MLIKLHGILNYNVLKLFLTLEGLGSRESALSGVTHTDGCKRMDGKQLRKVRVEFLGEGTRIDYILL